MTIEDAIERCSLGELRIHVRTAEEKQALLDLCHSMGYETGRCSADSYEEFSFFEDPAEWELRLLQGCRRLPIRRAFSALLGVKNFRI